MVHTIEKAEELVLTGAAALEDNLVLPATFRREGIDKFRGARDDTVNVVVDGVLPYRTYGWRNNRSTSLVFDEYSDRKVAVSFGDDIYSAVRLTDEQAEMDFDGWTKLASKQVEAIGRGLEQKAAAFLQDAPYEVAVQLDEADLRGSLAKLSVVFDKLMVPGQRTVLCGADLQVALLSDDKLAAAENIGETDAQSALRNATLLRRYNFEFVKANELTSGEAYAITPGGFIFLTAAPSVPQSVPFGATASVDGVALRWIRDYDSEKLQDRSIFNAYQDFHFVDDPLIGVDAGTKQAYVSDVNHFVRGVKVTVGTGYAIEVGNSELAAITGLESTDGTEDGA